MIPDVSTGSNPASLLAYLYGPGRHEEHSDPHLVAAWDLAGAPDPGRDSGAGVEQLAARLDQHAVLRAAELGAMPPQRSWHCPVRTAPQDPYLSDEQWAQVAHRIVAATGVAPEGDERSCRWVAVRHSEHHIHIAAVTVRADGRRAKTGRSGARAQAACRQIEKEWGLRRLGQGPAWTPSYPTTAEIAKAARLGWEQPSRLWLAAHVRAAAAAVGTEREFFAELATRTILVRLRTGPNGEAVGFSVARPDDVNSSGQPVYFAAGRLDSALSLPRIRSLLAARRPAGVLAFPDPVPPNRSTSCPDQQTSST
ncbi:relaxase/mobilization nuclease domain-containing protein [Kitasatospora indigofera]|uniref:relaxase/mobilization nuclease domain-containing protein n=1 Tax=Kitasatospora indigofera TaxID=67307 RepID=UPI0036436ED7